MIIDTLTLAISIVSAIVAIISVIFARNAVKTAERTYSMNLLSQIYEMCYTDAMYHATLCANIGETTLLRKLV
jgi:hypothetical protein